MFKKPKRWKQNVFRSTKVRKIEIPRMKGKNSLSILGNRIGK